MSTQSRQAKVFVALLLSMSACGLLLMALGRNPPSAGAFCLDDYYRLEPVEEVIFSRAEQCRERWDSIEVRFSGTKAGSTEQLASLRGLASCLDVDWHFCVCSGLGGGDGEIQTTAKWQQQRSAWLGDGKRDRGRTIVICVVGDGRTVPPTDYQIGRVEALVEQLCRRFDIGPECVCYPDQWR